MARLAATAASNAASVSAVTRDTPKPAATPTTAPPAPQTSPLAAVQPQSTPRAPANPTAEINAVISDYARAIESRDIAELKRVYPGITRQQQQAFSDFFSSIRSLQ